MSRAFITKINAFTPLAVPGCQLWMDAADSTTITRSGANVIQWNDKANNYSGSATNNPQYNSNPINSLPTIHFDGASSRYVLISANNYNYSFMTYFIVIRWVSGTGGFMGTDTPSNYGRALAVSSPNVQLLLYSQFYTTNIPLTANQPCILSAYFNGTTDFTVILNGTPTVFAVGQGTGNTNTNGFNIGVFNPSNGLNHSFDMGEGIVYSSILNEAQRQKVEGYLAQKWGLVSSLPPGHPGLTQTFYTAGKNPGIAAVPSFTITNAPYSNYFPLSVTGCSLWLDANDVNATGVNPAFGNITTWKDKITGLALTNSNPNTLVSNSINSLPGVRFPTTQTNGYGFQGTITNPSSTYPIIIFSVINPTYTGLRNCLIGYTSNDLNIFLYDGYYQQYNTSGYINTSGTVSATSGAQMLTAVYNSASSALYRNGTQIATGDTGTGTQYGGTLNIGGYPVVNNSTWQGDMNEVILYTKQLTNSQRQSIEGYLAWKWGITLTNTHPYYSRPPVEFGRPTQVAGIPIQVKMTATPNLTLPSNTIINGLVAYFLFNGTLLDSQNTITLSQTGSVSYVAGLREQAIYLANEANISASTFSSNYLSSTYNFPSTFTVSLWFRTANSSPASAIFNTNRNPTYVQGAVTLYYAGGSLYVAYTSVQNNGAGYAISANTWYNAVVTYNSGTTYLYVNGSQSGSAVNLTPVVINQGFMLGGSADNGPVYPFAGYIEDLRIYNRILSGSEITSIYNGTG